MSRRKEPPIKGPHRNTGQAGQHKPRAAPFQHKPGSSCRRAHAPLLAPCKAPTRELVESRVRRGHENNSRVSSIASRVPYLSSRTRACGVSCPKRREDTDTRRASRARLPLTRHRHDSFSCPYHSFACPTQGGQRTVVHSRRRRNRGKADSARLASRLSPPRAREPRTTRATHLAQQPRGLAGS